MFKFKGISSDSMEVFVTEHFPIPVSIPRVEEQTIPGRDGVVTYSDGSYEGSEIKGKVTITNKAKLDEISMWLSGWGELILPGAPDRMFIARVNNIVPIEQFIVNEVFTFPLSFKCQPFGYLLEGQEEVNLSNGTVINPGNINAKPVIIANGGTFSVTVNDKSFKVNGPEGESIIIDSELEEVHSLTTNKLIRYDGTFPVFVPGTNEIDGLVGSGTIKYNWRNK